MTVRVLVDATAIPADRGGVGRYLDDLLPALAAQDVSLVVAAQARDAALFGRRLATAEIVETGPLTVRRPSRLVWEQVGLPALARRLRVDLVHSPHYTMPRRSPVPVVVTLHDATFFSHPELHGSVKRRFFQSRLRVAVRRAAALVVPSAATRDEVLRLVGGEQSRFHVAYHGVDQNLFHRVEDAERDRVAASLGLAGRRYVGFLGTLEPRKNVPALVRGWVRAVQGEAAPPALVLAGGPGWDTDVAPAVAAVPDGLTVVQPGYLPLGDLPGFLSGATVLAYPSLGEGFGLPVLEAMACGAAVLTTGELSLPEVGGDAVAYCDTDDASIGEALRRLLDDAAERERLATAGVSRAAMFTWEASAAAHVAAYRAALAT